MVLLMLLLSQPGFCYPQAYFFESSKLIHFAIGAVCLVVVLASWLFEERDLVMFGVDRWRRQSLVKMD